MVSTFDRATGTYSNGMRLGELVYYVSYDGEEVEGIILDPDPVRDNNCWGIWSKWNSRYGSSYGYMPFEQVHRRGPVEILGDNDDDCI